MKKYIGIVCMFCVLYVLNFSAKGGTVVVLFEKHQVWGGAAGRPSFDTYDMTVITPTQSVSGNASALWWHSESDYPDPQRCLGTNIVFSSAGFFEVSATDQSCCEWTGSYATAKSKYKFRPNVEDLKINFTGGVQMHSFENWVSFSLFDITENFEVDSYLWKTEGYYDENLGLSDPVIDQTLSFPVNPLHEYWLELYAQVAIGDTPGVTSHLHADILPEPVTAGFMIFGAVLIALRHRQGKI